MEERELPHQLAINSTDLFIYYAIKSIHLAATKQANVGRQSGLAGAEPKFAESQWGRPRRILSSPAELDRA